MTEAAHEHLNQRTCDLFDATFSVNRINECLRQSGKRQIDHGIRPVVIALLMHGFDICKSSEGSETFYPYFPWVEIKPRRNVTIANEADRLDQLYEAYVRATESSTPSNKYLLFVLIDTPRGNFRLRPHIMQFLDLYMAPPPGHIVADCLRELTKFAEYLVSVAPRHRDARISLQ